MGTGSFIGNELNNETAWVFDKFRTKKGCISYWDECDFQSSDGEGMSTETTEKVELGEEEFALSDKSAQRRLASLVKLKLVIMSGDKKGARYKAKG